MLMWTAILHVVNGLPIHIRGHGNAIPWVLPLSTATQCTLAWSVYVDVWLGVQVQLWCHLQRLRQGKQLLGV